MYGYRIVGDYGIGPDDYIVWTGRAKTDENAMKRAIKEFKKSRHWNRIGEHNVHIHIKT